MPEWRGKSAIKGLISRIVEEDPTVAMGARPGQTARGNATSLVKNGGRIAQARVGVTGLAAKAYRATNVENALTGKTGTAEEIQHASAVIAEGVEANRDIHASSDYRKHLARVYAMRALAVASSRMT